MRLLLDECVPKRLKAELVGHDVLHVVDMGWSSKRNGELLKLMLVERFEALLTVDRHIEFQQNVRNSGIGVLVVRARTNRLTDLRPLVPHILEGLSRIYGWGPHQSWWLTTHAADGARILCAAADAAR
jgi:hypothetical protein